MTDSSASDDVGMIFQRLIGERNSKTPRLFISFLDFLIIHQHQLYRQLLDFSISNATARTSRHVPPDDACQLTFVHIILSSSHFIDTSSSGKISKIPHLLSFTARNPSFPLDFSSTDQDVFYVERSSEGANPLRNNVPAVLNSTQLPGAMTRETTTISSAVSPEPQIVTKEPVYKELTITYGFGNQHPIVPHSLIGLHLPPNPFYALATMTVIQPDDEFSPQSPEPSNASPISTPPMTMSTIEGWETPQPTTDEKNYFEDVLRRVYWHISSSETFYCIEPRQLSKTSTPSSIAPLPQREKRKLSRGCLFLKERECRSTPARHAASSYQWGRHTNVHKKHKQ